MLFDIFTFIVYNAHIEPQDPFYPMNNVLQTAATRPVRAEGTIHLGTFLVGLMAAAKAEKSDPVGQLPLEIPQTSSGNLRLQMQFETGLRHHRKSTRGN